MKKALLGILVVVIVAVAGIGYYVLSSLDSIIKEQIEVQGSKALGTPVRVGGVTVKLRDGLGQLDNFTIANPQGFSNKSAVAFKTVRLDIGTENITQMPIVIEEILVDAPSALYELNAAAKANLNTLLNQVKSSSGGSSAEPATQPEASQGGESSDVRIRVDKITFKDVSLALDLESLRPGTSFNTVLPTFHASNVGGSQGLPPAELGQAIGKIMLSNLVEQAKKQQVAKLQGQVEERVREEVDKVKQQAEEEVKKVEGKAKEELKGLFDKLGQ